MARRKATIFCGGWWFRLSKNEIPCKLRGKKPLTILNGSRKNSRQMRSVPLWIHRSPAERGMKSTDFQSKDMADREAGSGKEQKRVATNRTKTDLRSWRRQNSWNCHLTCPTKRKADFDTGRLQISRKFIACWQICWHLKPLYLLAFQLFFTGVNKNIQKTFQ